MLYLIFDTETTGLPKNYKAPVSDSENWPRAVQISWQLHNHEGALIDHQDFLIKPEGFDIPFLSEKIHGISTALAIKEGRELSQVLNAFEETVLKSDFVVGQNIDFDLNIMGAEFYRMGITTTLLEKKILDTCTERTANLCQLTGGRGGKFKLPTLSELHQRLFETTFEEAHNASADVEATARCFFELIRIGEFDAASLGVTEEILEQFKIANPNPIKSVGLRHKNLKAASEKLIVKDLQSEEHHRTLGESVEVSHLSFAHLHNHSQFSILQATMKPAELVAVAAELEMPGVALTDTGNMMGSFSFVSAVAAHNKSHPENPIKGVIGCELAMVEDCLNKKIKDLGYPIVLLAKNKQGYHNLTKLSSKAYTEGFYYIPRIDKKLLVSHKEGLIALSGGTRGEISAKLLNVGERQAEEALEWFKENFGDDFYLQLERHSQEEENRVNQQLITLAKKHEIHLVATNNNFYRSKEDQELQDILLCVKEGELRETPIGRGRGYRYGLPNSEYYFKSAKEMKALFADLPQAIENTSRILDKVENYALYRDVLLPKFDIPQEFESKEDKIDNGKRGENTYLKHLTFEGAKKRYEEISSEIEERLKFELNTIEQSGYPGYFLIVEDFIRKAREMGVSVGPGRGSAAGSAVAYCLGITNIDPIKYDLLFERFLNPDRVSMPDIDIDFDDEGRQKVINYVIDKYGSNQVAQIITYGTMAGKSSIRDTARVLDLPLNEADRLAKLLPDMTKLAKVLELDSKSLQKNYRSEEAQRIAELQQISKSKDDLGNTLQVAKRLEGTLRNTGIHACGVIITPSDITDFVPVATAKDAEMWVTQFDNSVVESAGLLKMDFLGLKTLTLIKDTLKIIKARTGIKLNPDEFSLEDEKTYELFQRGETIGIFQYESRGMQKYLKELKPSSFDDLIAMNALYRPGPLEYIPSFIARKHGKEPITYDLPEMKEYLENTYGITVYQEQVMLLSQKLGGFTKGEADVLRKAMGKKKKDLIDELRPKFINGGITKGHPKEILEKIYKDWEAFASYAFNKSHSTCYAYIAYQTAYLKAHYPAEYMAAVLSNNMNQLEQVTIFMEEAKRMGIAVLGPDVNESFYKFGVNAQNAIRFGMGAIKGVGKSAVETIVGERKESGPFKSVFELAKRIDLRSANKRTFENLAIAGAFDSFGALRSQYFQESNDGINYLEKIIKSAIRFKENENASQVSLFADDPIAQISEPEIPPCTPWPTMELLRKEKEVVGLYLTGHPLDDFKKTLQHFTKNRLSGLNVDLTPYVGREVTVGGVVTMAEARISKNGKRWGTFTLEDFSGSYQFRVFSEEFLKFEHFFKESNFLYLRLLVKEGYPIGDGTTRGEPRLQFNEVKLLQDVIESLSKKINLHFKAHELNPELIKVLQQRLKQHKGSKPLNITLHEKDLQLTLKSRKEKVAITKDLLYYLDEQNIPYQLY
jgi:DNA polymerase-3 subunit alpha